MTGPVKRRFPKSAKPAPAVTRASIVNARKPPPVPKTSTTGSPAAPKTSSIVPPAAPTTSSSGLPADFFDSPSAPSSKLPADFFDSSNAPSAKRVRTDEAGNNQRTTSSASAVSEPVARKAQNGVVHPATSTTPFAGGDVASGKVPEGFFDNVDADHRARGLEPPKVDIKEEYKEFQKSIKVDLVAADVQQEEEEEEAADIREELEVIEQRSLMERVEILRKAKEERVAKVKAESVVAFPAAMGVDDDDDSEDEDGDDDDIAYDWRAKEI
ncbi:hypothetical protein M758_4G091800 [Ceratodon purpureus]|nr:hypothetical protein M758_4G091800 [Ceratodon purpureus]